MSRLATHLTTQYSRFSARTRRLADLRTAKRETLYELADRDYGLDVWVLLPSYAANEMMENAVHGNSSVQAGTAAIAAINGYMREHIKLLEQTARLFAEAQKQRPPN
jgi:hypothetical protein